MDMYTTARRLGRKNELPPWWKLVVGVLTVVGFFFLAWQAITPAPPPQAPPLPPASLYHNLVTTPTVALARPNHATTQVPQVGGGSVLVPTAALTVATSATRALYTTNFAGVPLANGAVVPQNLPQAWPNPQITNPQVLSASSTQITFSFLVDPDGPTGPQQPREIATTVATTATGWGYTGA